ncbi:MAG TPA: hypothetical protein VLU43_01295 [Anaeromyxobacteraceae bacterium]|nr:hypothetical protein [Anaeromyxobacteraceae bacterium]
MKVTTARALAALALALAVGTASAAEVVPQRAESAESFLCRSKHVPAARRCADRCGETFVGDEQAEARWSCVHACTVKGLWAISECRAEITRQGGATMFRPASVAAR